MVKKVLRKKIILSGIIFVLIICAIYAFSNYGRTKPTDAKSGVKTENLSSRHPAQNADPSEDIAKISGDSQKRQQAITKAQEYVRAYIVNSKDPRWDLAYADWRPVDNVSFRMDEVEGNPYWEVNGKIDTVTPEGENVLISYGIRMDQNYRVIMSDIGE